ncbi:unnamed protein product [Amoebophrya sp. A120]|nr:unnamed protein product [Amoebophrya sp. A120]|eukprot:GSA120T00025091001.1
MVVYSVVPSKIMKSFALVVYYAFSLTSTSRLLYGFSSCCCMTDCNKNLLQDTFIVSALSLHSSRTRAGSGDRSGRRSSSSSKRRSSPTTRRTGTTSASSSSSRQLPQHQLLSNLQHVARGGGSSTWSTAQQGNAAVTNYTTRNHAGDHWQLRVGASTFSGKKTHVAAELIKQNYYQSWADIPETIRDDPLVVYAGIQHRQWQYVLPEELAKRRWPSQEERASLSADLQKKKSHTKANYTAEDIANHRLIYGDALTYLLHGKATAGKYATERYGAIGQGWITNWLEQVPEEHRHDPDVVANAISLSDLITDWDTEVPDQVKGHGRVVNAALSVGEGSGFGEGYEPLPCLITDWQNQVPRGSVARQNLTTVSKAVDQGLIFHPGDVERRAPGDEFEVETWLKIASEVRLDWETPDQPEQGWCKAMEVGLIYSVGELWQTPLLRDTDGGPENIEKWRNVVRHVFRYTRASRQDWNLLRQMLAQKDVDSPEQLLRAEVARLGPDSAWWQMLQQPGQDRGRSRVATSICTTELP